MTAAAQGGIRASRDHRHGGRGGRRPGTGEQQMEDVAFGEKNMHFKFDF